MRLFFVCFAAASITLAYASTTNAQNAPWCAHYDFGSDESVNCGFVSFDQCLGDVRGVGGFCMRNNTYVPVSRSHWRDR
jgi:hypothetical protein